jgi:hypothetical protein
VEPSDSRAAADLAAPGGSRSAAASTSAASAAPAPPASALQTEEALRFAAPGFVPGGIAFDAVSGRFLFGVRHDRKIVVVGEQSDRAVDLVRAASAGFFDVVALEIDPRRGDLWVASVDDRREGGRAALHKLQLVSGRPLATFELPAETGAVGLFDLAVTREGAVIALDEEGARLWRLVPGQPRPEVLAALPGKGYASLAVDASARFAYLADAGGLTRVDLGSGAVRRLTAATGVDLSNLERLRWHGGSLVAVQRTIDLSARLLRLRLDAAGRRIVRSQVLVPGLEGGRAPMAATLWGDDFFYVSGPPGSADPAILRRVRLR